MEVVTLILRFLVHFHLDAMRRGEPCGLRAAFPRLLYSATCRWALDMRPAASCPLPGMKKRRRSRASARTHGLLTQYAQLRTEGYRDNPERFATEFVEAPVLSFVPPAPDGPSRRLVAQSAA